MFRSILEGGVATLPCARVSHGDRRFRIVLVVHFSKIEAGGRQGAGNGGQKGERACCCFAALLLLLLPNTSSHFLRPFPWPIARPPARLGLISHQEARDASHGELLLLRARLDPLDGLQQGVPHFGQLVVRRLLVVVAPPRAPPEARAPSSVSSEASTADPTAGLAAVRGRQATKRRGRGAKPTRGTPARPRVRSWRRRGVRHAAAGLLGV